MISLKITEEEIERRFTYHKPKDDQSAKYETLRAAAKEFAQLINATVPDSREKCLAITKLEESSMWANAGIARRE